MEDADHVPVRYEHIHAKDLDLGVQSEILADSPVDDDVPAASSCLLGSVKADSISPKMWHSTHYKLELCIVGVVLCDKMRILHKLEVELIEVCFDVHAL